MKRVVHAPDGSTWSVASRWYRRPRYHRWWKRAPDGDWLEILMFADVGESLTAALVGIAVVIVVALVVFFLLPLVLFLLEVPVVALLVLAIRRLWIVEAISDAGTRRAWTVRGWRRSRRAVREVAHELELGVHAEPEEALRPA